MPTVKPNEYESVIAESERRTESLRRIHELATSDPKLFEHAMKSLGYVRDGAATKRPRHSSGQTNYERIVQYFKQSGNTWRPARDIVHSTDIQRGAVSIVLYTTHRSAFRQKVDPKNKGRRLWRLKGGGGDEKIT